MSWVGWTRSRWLKEPLVHFLLAGGLVFAIAQAWSGPSDEGRSIRLDREDMITFLQSRAQVYEHDTFSALLDRMEEAERAVLVRDLAIQEALYREGMALRLADADPLVRQRVVQQMRLLLMEEAASDMNVSETEARDFYASHRDDYALPAAVTFTHVFIPSGQSAGQAEALLARLRRDGVPPGRAGQFGERFLYQSNYSDAGPALVDSHFGDAFTQELFSLPQGSWQGPLRSEHGEHLVLVSARSEGRTPAFEDIAGAVREDALASKRQIAADAALDRMLDRYEIVLEDTAQ